MAASKTRIASSILTVSITLTLTLTLPSSLPILVPAMESTVFIHIPSLWHSLLSWLTPSCLFVLLNGIIVILSASSGLFNSSHGSDFYTNLLSKVEKQGTALMIESGVTSPCRPSPKRVPKSPSHSNDHEAMCIRNASPRWNLIDGDLHYVSSHPKSFSFHPVPVYRWTVVSETDDVDEWESSAAFRIRSNPAAISLQHNSTQHNFNCTSVTTSQRILSSPTKHAKSQSAKHTTEIRKQSPISPKETSATSTPKNVETNSTPKANKISSKKALDTINTSTFTENIAANSMNTPKKCGSEPSSPHYATQSTKSDNNNSIKRSLSIDSAQDPSRKDDAPSENLNDDEFRKMIETFITEKKKKLMTE